jgi:hypothetical protein
MKFIRDLFRENSSISCMRVMAMISLFAAVYLAIIGKNDCVMIFVAAAFGGKVAQKITEGKNRTIVNSKE